MIHDLAGFTGRLIAKILNNHRDRTSFTFALAARSQAKLSGLVEEFDLSAQIPLFTLDVTNADDVENVVKTARVVINTVGPYWLWGTPVVRYVRSERALRYSTKICYAERVLGTGSITLTSQVRK